MSPFAEILVFAAVIILTPLVTNYFVKRVNRPLPPRGGAKILHFPNKK